MPMEQETVGLLVGGFSLIIGIMVLVTLFLWVKSKGNHAAYASVICHFAFLTIAMFVFINAITFNADHPMASEEISLRLGVSGVVWAVGMLCLLVGLVRFSKGKMV